MITMYGIRNCDTVKKARAWLEKHRVAYAFHDYKTAGVDRKRLEAWCDELGWEALLHRASMTFRKLPLQETKDLNRDKAVKLMLAHPSAIKRPVLDLGTKRLVGFRPELYGALARK